ncbi:MAG TPA: D-alanyl-D-alanine carboxypeptidase family protein [Candidatus Binatia bacterium]|jgi:D-alanyl-D-alanine carboxypeptidase (penicillin-binding protein 5/6)|nr:D-alanyl-D-alanine carboxypeptidase family protein [Candidatus Binatia bacterium]
MTRRISSTALALVLALATPGAAPAARFTLSARAAIIIDAATGESLFEKNADEPLPPASTTKVMTAILALESGRLDESFRVSEFAAETAPSKINLRPGERVRLKNLLYAVLLNSANDAAEVVAEGLGGSQAGFAEQMNERARALGAPSAHFVNPHGLTAPGHVASARDLAVIFRHGLRLPLFREILETRTIAVPVEAGSVHWVSLRSHNRLLTGYTYPVIGKTGYTRPARRCFVGASEHDNREIVIALLGSTDLWGDAKKLFNRGFGAIADRPTVVMADMVPIPGLSHRAPAKTVAEGDEDQPSEAARSAATTRFAVQLGPYSSRRAAALARSRLARRGYTAVPAGRSLRIGSFSTENRARRVALRLRLTGYHPKVVTIR